MQLSIRFQMCNCFWNKNFVNSRSIEI